MLLGTRIPVALQRELEFDDSQAKNITENLMPMTRETRTENKKKGLGNSLVIRVTTKLT